MEPKIYIYSLQCQSSANKFVKMENPIFNFFIFSNNQSLTESKSSTISFMKL